MTGCLGSGEGTCWPGFPIGHGQKRERDLLVSSTALQNPLGTVHAWAHLGSLPQLMPLTFTPLTPDLPHPGPSPKAHTSTLIRNTHIFSIQSSNRVKGADFHSRPIHYYREKKKWVSHPPNKKRHTGVLKFLTKSSVNWFALERPPELAEPGWELLLVNKASISWYHLLSCYRNVLFLKGEAENVPYTFEEYKKEKSQNMLELEPSGDKKKTKSA